MRSGIPNNALDTNRILLSRTNTRAAIYYSVLHILLEERRTFFLLLVFCIYREPVKCR